MDIGYSDHLFWDVDKSQFDLDLHKQWLVGRVLEYGLMQDWLLLKGELGVQGIAEIAKDIKQLDRVSLIFIATLSEQPIEEFAAYSKPKSSGSNWLF